MKKKRKLPTPAQITKEIAKLEKMKPTVRSHSGFGDDHHAAIDAQIEVLREALDEDEIYVRWQGEENHARNNALLAMGWRDGDYGDGEAPSEGWKQLVRR